MKNDANAADIIHEERKERPRIVIEDEDPGLRSRSKSVPLTSRREMVQTMRSDMKK